ncbi:hypothetical protein VTL71DRAFT_7939 [Oculimacula yallundae]|uniref:CBM1 domain-containing protein n=1 Tax=Oculimacula yallundae TaxID=86028 RepID=A0ABR4CYF6_9HELO
MFLLQGAAILAASLLSGSVEAVASQAFTWKNVKIGGGGGFVPGIVFNPSLKGLAYARTDIGGAYRLNADDSWTPLLDSVNTSNWHNWGVDALATDPVDTNRVYAAVGLYTNEWDPEAGSILRSNDQGNTWTETKLPFKVGGNMPGRGIGERLAIDPKSNNIIYYGARSGNGLYKSTDFGVTFSKVTAFKWPGTYVQDASTSYTSDIVGIAWITFDTTTGTKGSATPRIFVGVVDVGQSVFKSEDGGVTWAWVSGAPLGFLPHKGVLSPAEKVLYVSYSNGAGPYDGTNGTLHKYNITSGVWTDISPVPVSTTTYGYGGLAVDLKVPGTLMVAALNSWWPDEQIWRSTNGGATWSPIWEFNGYPNMNRYYGYDVSQAPWLQDKSSTKEFPQNVGWMVEALVIDPFDSNHWLYGTGATIYGGRDLQKWDTVHNVTLKSLADGIEETAVLGLLVAPGGPTLLSAVGDIGGFTHKDLDVAPDQAWHTPTYGTTRDLDYAGNKPSNLVRTGESTTDIAVAVSFNYASTWNQYYGGSLATGSGKVAISADADTILLMSTTSGSLISKNSATFSSIPTLPSGAAIASDKKNNNYFYGGSVGSVYVSSNGGTTFAKTATLGASKAISQIRVHPTVAGDVWISTDVGLFHSTNFGSTFTQVASGVTAGWSFALGAGATASSYPAIYGFFTIGGTTALFKTEDAGVNWFMISDAAHGFGSAAGNVVGADTVVYGKVYVGTNGRGIFYGVASGTLPPSTTTGSSTSKPTSSSTSIRTSSSVPVTSSSTLVTSSKPVTVTPTTSSSKSSTVTSRTSTTTSPAPTGVAPAGPYGQCGGGPTYTGPTTCVAGWKCVYGNPFYSQCQK